ncbi:MAG: OmpW family protein [Rhodospirillales bacterium]|nr:OmpW family protein [Rhodospirillales bacterium]
MKSLLTLALVAGVSLSAMSVPAFAQDGAGPFAKERWQFRLRTIGVLPDSGGHTSIGGKPHADNAVVPEFDITYFFTDHVAAELILATSKHDLKLKGPNLDLGESWILPPTLTVQYHFTPKQAFSPYVGAGLNYTLPYAEDDGADTTSLKADGSFGTALQVGFDYWMNDNWGLNMDVKKVWVDVDARVNGTITGNVELNPWIVGAGVSYRF